MYNPEGEQFFFENEGMRDTEVSYLSAEEFPHIKCPFLVFNPATHRIGLTNPGELGKLGPDLGGGGGRLRYSSLARPPAKGLN